ncbi:MAG: cell division protein FtsZ [Candidatus Kapabacteria bacterium]|nr:cell division protein FtsZ [Candidatus Kapabacteria bacterium]
MPIELDTTLPPYDARIRVVGVGGGGGNAVRTMITRGLEGVEFVAANTDHQALMNNPATVKLQLGKLTTRGLGAGANPEVGRKAVDESIDDVRDALEGSDMVFVTAGMGGGTGTGAAPVIARVGREVGALVVGIVTKPFAYESKRRMAIADQGIKDLREHVDALIIIPNQRILSIVDRNVPFVEALAKVDNVLYNATKGIADIISGVGYVNVDFADVRTVMAGMGDALMGIGVARGDHRALEAATNALNSPILDDMSIDGAQGLLVNVTGGPSMTMHEVGEVVSTIERAAGEDVNLIHGVVVDERMEDEISVTVVATGFRTRQEQLGGTEETRTVHVVAAPMPAVEPVVAPVEAEARAEAPAPAPSPTFVPVNPVIIRPQQQKPVGPDELEAFDTPAVLRRQNGDSQQNTSGMPTVVQPTQSARQAAANADRPAFLRRIMD